MDIKRSNSDQDIDYLVNDDFLDITLHVITKNE